jgi:hypothetical protein
MLVYNREASKSACANYGEGTMNVIRFHATWLVGISIAASFAMAETTPEGWTTAAPREEIKPSFKYEAVGGRAGHAALVIAGDNREGTSGWWQKMFEVEGGKTYRFSAWRQTDAVDSPRLSGLARVQWRDAKGKSIKRDEASAGRYLHGARPTAEPEYLPTRRRMPPGGLKFPIRMKCLPALVRRSWNCTTAGGTADESPGAMCR